MSTILLIIAIIAAHVFIVSVALFVIIRSGVYSRKQVVIQLLLALFIPLFRPVLLISMAKNATAPPPEPDNSRFDPERFGPG